MRLGSLFTGYGGLDLAVEATVGPCQLQWYSDIKPAAVAFGLHRHPGIPNLGDITLVDFTEVPPIDILAGSWPCQPESSAGKRAGRGGPPCTLALPLRRYQSPPARVLLR